MNFAILALSGVAAAGSIGTFYFAYKINKSFNTTVEKLETEIQTTRDNTNKSIRRLQGAIATANLEV